MIAMQLIDATCAHCGAQLTIDRDNGTAYCKFCGAELILNQQDQSINTENAERIGYQFEKGRQRAQQETIHQQTMSDIIPPPVVRKRHTFWWVIGWIFIFPIPTTILVARNKNLKNWIKALIILGVWLIYLLIGVLSRNS